MPSIDLQLNHLETTQTLGYVVEDLYVKGGYRIVATDQAIWASANGNVLDASYQSELQSKAIAGSEGSLKIGCLVFDRTSGSYFRCTSVDPVTFIEAFAGNSNLDPALYVQRNELPLDAITGAIDIASDAELAEALLDSVRVSGAAGSETVNLTARLSADGEFHPALGTLIVNATAKSGTTPASVEIVLNRNSFAADAFTV